MKTSSAPCAITVAIAERSPIIRKGLRSILEAQPDFQVVLEADDGVETGDTVQELKPLVLVTNNSADGLELAMGVTARSRTGTKAPAVVVVAESPRSSEIHAALRSGAMACILADSEPEEVVRAIRQVTKGEYYLSPIFLQDLIRQFATGNQWLDRYDTLTPRQRQIFNLSIHDHTSAEIANSLKISRRTVEVHRAIVRKKLGFNRYASFARYLQEKGDIPGG